MPELLTLPRMAGDVARDPPCDPPCDPHNDSGQSLLEMAMVLPFFFALVIGFINFCMVICGLCSMSYACEQADRYACLHSNTSLAPASQSAVDAMVSPFVFGYPSNTYTDTLSYGGTGNVVGGTATVRVRVVYTITFFFMTIHAIKLSSSCSGTIIQ